MEVLFRQILERLHQRRSDQAFLLRAVTALARERTPRFPSHQCLRIDLGAVLHLIQVGSLRGVVRQARARQGEREHHDKSHHQPALTRLAVRVRVGQREHEQRSAERRVLGKILVAADGAEAFGVAGQTGRHADARPAADTGIRADVLLAAVLVREHVADDSGGRLELPQLLAVLGADGLDVAFERAVEHDVARGRERAGPYREALRLRPDDLALSPHPTR